MRAPVRARTTLGGVGATALTACILLSGCGFADALAHPQPQTPAPTTAGTAAPTSAAAPSLTADLVGSVDGPTGSLAVTVSAVQPGVPPLYVAGGLAADCRLDPATTEYRQVTVLFVSGFVDTKATRHSANLRLDLRVDDGSTAGVLLQPRILPESFCDGSDVPTDAVLQTEDLSDEHQTLTAYVVARTGDDGQDPLLGAMLELGDLRHHPNDVDGTDWTWGPQDIVGGSTCADDPGSLCLPLG